MRSSLLDYAFSVLTFYKTAAGLRVNITLCHNHFIHCWFVSKVNLFMFCQQNIQ